MVKKFSCIIFLLILLQSFAFPFFLTLYDGTLLLGDIIEQDESKIIFRCWNNDAVLEIPWIIVHPRQRSSIQEKIGLSIPEEISLKIPGHTIYLKNGGNIMGKILTRNSQQIILKNKAGELLLSTANILREEPMEVPLLEVFKVNEVFLEIQKNYDLNKAAGNWELARILIIVGDLDKATQLLDKTLFLDPSYQNRVANFQQKIAKISQENQQQKVLGKFFSYRKIQRFAEALQVLDTLKNIIPIQEWQSYHDETIRLQSEFTTETIAQLWLQKAWKKIYAVSIDSKKTFAEVQNYVSRDMSLEIVKELAQEKKMEENDIQTAWENRKSSSEYRYSYRDGTFVVGLGQISKETQGRGFSMDTLRQSSLPNAQEWWQRASTTSRKEWLAAYYCERCLDVVRHELKTCPNCSGQGTQYAANKIVVCAYCHGLKNEKIVIAK